MKNERIEALDGATKTSVVLVDCTAAAGELARAHLSGPASSGFLAQALAGVALLGAETSAPDETVTFRLDCAGPLEGFLVECTEKGTLRGYAKKKILDDLDVLGRPPKPKEALGASGTVEIIRSVPGSILSSGAVAVANPSVASALDAYFDQSLQRRVRVAVVGAAGEDGVPLYARGVLVERPPDGDEAAFAEIAARFDSALAEKALAADGARTILKKLGLAQAEIRKTTPLAFACRCSAERARATLATLSPEERAQLPPTIDVTCHLCGRTWTVVRGS